MLIITKGEGSGNSFPFILNRSRELHPPFANSTRHFNFPLCPSHKFPRLLKLQNANLSRQTRTNRRACVRPCLTPRNNFRSWKIRRISDSDLRYSRETSSFLFCDTDGEWPGEWQPPIDPVCCDIGLLYLNIEKPGYFSLENSPRRVGELYRS